MGFQSMHSPLDGWWPPCCADTHDGCLAGTEQCVEKDAEAVFGLCEQVCSDGLVISSINTALATFIVGYSLTYTFLCLLKTVGE